jgi:hypothetical protein
MGNGPYTGTAKVTVVGPGVTGEDLPSKRTKAIVHLDKDFFLDKEGEWWRRDESGCWEWLMHRVQGFGMARVGGRKYVASRLAHELLLGPIPKGWQVKHSCENRGCVNPAHLKAQVRNWTREARQKMVARTGRHKR